MIERRLIRGRGLHRRHCRRKRNFPRRTTVLEVRHSRLRGDWEVTLHGSRKPFLFRPTKKEAVGVARGELKESGGEIQVFNETGKVAERVRVFK